MEEHPITDTVIKEDEPFEAQGGTVHEGTAAPDTKADASPQLGVAIQHWVNNALEFFSHASNETLGACFVGLGASTYLVLGRVGLVLIGVVGGIALHATWEGTALSSAEHQPEAEVRKRRELGLEVVQRVWKWQDRQRHKSNEQDGAEVIGAPSLKDKQLDFTDFQAKTGDALEAFTNAVIRDYVKWWYSPVLPGEESFPTACRGTLTAFLRSLSSHVSRKRPEEMFLNLIINSSSIVIAFLSELSAALNASPNTDAVSAIDTYIQLKPDSTLAQMLDRTAQDRKLMAVAEDILQNYLEPKAYEFPPVRVFLQQILSRLILGKTLDTCSKAEWINGWIVYGLEDGEPEIMQVIDAGVDGVDKAKVNELPKQNGRSRGMSKAEEAMDEAMQEARRLTQLIQEEEAKRLQEQSPLGSSAGDTSSSGQGIYTPTSSQSESDRVEAAARNEPVPVVVSPASAETPMTTFDQILPTIPTSPEASRPVLTLVNAKVSIFDDATPGDRSAIKSRPTAEYLVQIEPSDSRLSGWMIARKYADFEVLHEVLRRISVITGVRFTETHNLLPAWKQATKNDLRIDLERYLIDALKYQQLAECEGMKRFLEKDQNMAKSPSANKGLGWPDPMSVGKGMMDVLTKAPKEVTSGSKALFGGVTSVLGGGKKGNAPWASSGRNNSSSSLGMTSPQNDRMSSDLIRRQLGGDQDPSRMSMDMPGVTRALPLENGSRPSTSSRASVRSRSSTEGLRSSPSKTPDRTSTDQARPAAIDTMNLPPPPSLIDDVPMSGISPGTIPAAHAAGTSARITPPASAATPTISTSKAATTGVPKHRQSPLTEQEATVTLDLLFATITELYTLSSAWTFRRTLLTAARTFLLRPGNPQLEAIRTMIQESVIDANASDAGLAKLILKTRENSLPTEEELKAWPAPPTEAAKEDLRIKARKLLVERGMPQALTSVMGAAASGEALGKVFDCLQVENVARSLMFGLMLQALRAVVQ